MGDRTLRRFIVALLVAVTFTVVVSEPASGGDRLSKAEAYHATLDKLFSTFAKGRVNTLGVHLCRRRGPATINCKAIANDDAGFQTFDCNLIYTVRSTGGRIKATLLKKHCVVNPTPLLTRGQARDGALAEGSRRAGQDVAIERLIREGRSDFSVEVIWMKQTEPGIEECSLGIGVFASKLRITSRSDRLIQCHPADADEFDGGSQTGPGPKYCPGNAGKTWNAKPEIEGRSFDDAVNIAKAHKCSIRIVREDGVDLAITEDFSYQRLNVAVEGPEQTIIEVVGVF